MQKQTIILTLISGVLFTALLVTVINPKLADKVHRQFNPYGPELRAYYEETAAYQFRLDQNIPARAHLFVGDSLVQSLCTSCITQRSINFGIGRDTTKGVSARLEQYRSLQTAQSIFLSVGVNDLKYRSVTETIQNYQKLLSIPPTNVKIIVNAVWPVNPNINPRWRDYPPKIDELNDQLGLICSQMEHCRYFDITQKLKDTSGHLRKELQVGDGIHLNREGYALVIDALEKVYR